MDENTDTTAQEPQETPEDVTDPTTTDEPDNGPPDEPETFDRNYVTGLRDEAAQHRVRARDLEAKVGQLRDRLLIDNIRHLAADVLADPGDLLTFGERDDLLDEDGLPDPDAILNAARALAQDKPHIASRRPAGRIEQGAREEPDGSVDLASILRQRAS
jgi:hypothetical protein